MTENGLFSYTFGTETTPLIAAPGCLQKRTPEGGEREDGLFQMSTRLIHQHPRHFRCAGSMYIFFRGERGVPCASARFHNLCIVHAWCLSTTLCTCRVCVQCSCTAVGAKSFLKLLDPRLRSLCLLTATPSPLLSAARLPRFGIPVKRRSARVGRLLRSYALTNAAHHQGHMPSPSLPC